MAINTMDSEHSVTQYIEDLKRGDHDAAQKIWERFLHRLIALADIKLKASPRKAMDEEDIVQAAFTQFFHQVEQGRFPKLDDRDDLWQVLAMLVDRRAKDQIKQQNTQRAGGGNVRGESIFLTTSDSDNNAGIAGVAGSWVPAPDLAAAMAELLRKRLAGLPDDEYRQIALLKMEGYSNTEIADKLDIALRTVERRLSDIRETWGRGS